MLPEWALEARLAPFEVELIRVASGKIERLRLPTGQRQSHDGDGARGCNLVEVQRFAVALQHREMGRRVSQLGAGGMRQLYRFDDTQIY